MRKIGCTGFVDNEWPSLNRTREFYLRALTGSYELIFDDAKRNNWFNNRVDAVVQFTGNRAWLNSNNSPFPRIFAMHGGAVLDRELLSKLLASLRTADTLLVARVN
jgi:hypothetical protein